MGENGRREESSVGKQMVDRRGGINENKANERGKAVSDRGKRNATKGSESKEKRYGTCLPFVYRKEKVRCFARSSVVITKRSLPTVYCLFRLHYLHIIRVSGVCEFYGTGSYRTGDATNARHEIAGHENAAPCCRGWKMRDMKMRETR